jgi:hypothetical protein
LSTSRRRVDGLRERRDDPVKIPGEVKNDADPAPWATLPEQPLSTRPSIGLAVIGVFDGEHYVKEKGGHMRMPFANMIPGFPEEFNGSAVRASDEQVHGR